MKYILNNDNLEVVGKQYLKGVGNYTGNTTNASDLATVINAKAEKSEIPTESTVSNWGFTKNKGTVTNIKANGVSLAQDDNGEVIITAADLGIASALKYCGTTTTPLTDGATTNPVVIDGENHTAAQGCVVFYEDSGNTKEFVFNGTKWELLGSDLTYKVVQKAVSSPNANGNAVSFIDTISQDANGVITATKKNVKIPTPDWNAQEGEAGYIENKPITKKFIKEQSMEFSHVDEWHSIYEGYDAVPSNTTVAKVFADITTSVGEHITTTVIVKKGESVGILENDENNYLDISMYNEFEGLTMNVSASFEFGGTLKCYYYEEFKQLDEDYIPDTVLKTTPQTLTTAEKNQVKENLGISASDWNSQEGQTGYIKNRTHYVYGGDYIFWGKLTEGELVDSTYYFDVYDHTRVCLSVRGHTAYDVEQLLISLRVFDTQTFTTENGYLFTVTLQFDPDSDSYKLAITPEDGIFDWHNEMDILILDTETHISKLSEAFIPDSIARKSEFTTINGQSITEGGNIDLVADGDEVSSLTLKPGCKIGSFSVDSDNNLSSDYEHVVISNNGITISSDDMYTTITGGRLQITSEREDTPAMSIIGLNGIEIASLPRNQIDYAIRAHDGMFAGLRPWVRVINGSSSSSDKTLTELDHTILIYASSQQTIVLPDRPKDGQEYDILMSLTSSTSVKHVVSSNSANIFVPKEGNLKSSLTIDAHGYIKLIYVKDTGFWWYYRMA